MERKLFLFLCGLLIIAASGCRIDPLVGADGGLQFSGVPAEGGAPGLQASLSGGRGASAEDMVLYWNTALQDVIRDHAVWAHQESRADYGPDWTSRDLAMINAAMYDAVVAVKGGYEPYLASCRAPKGTSAEAAANAAAYYTARALYPDQKKVIDAAFRSAPLSCVSSKAKALGVQVGKTAALACLDARENDGAGDIVRYPVGTAVGEWRPTWPDYGTAWWPEWGNVTPFVIKSASAFDIPGPPPVSSQAYARDYQQVKILGAADSAVRTPEQTLIAVFWSYDAVERGSPILQLNQLTLRLASERKQSLLENARLFALTSLALADSAVVAWLSKYEYLYWRPITAIREGCHDGNPSTVGDPGWIPLGYTDGGLEHRTPSFPTCMSGHSIFAGAYFTMLARYFGTDSMKFTVISDELPGVVRSYSSFSSASDEVLLSRVYLGVHFMFDNLPAQKAGNELSDWVFEHALRPR